jgi:hypothetical protein
MESSFLLQQEIEDTQKGLSFYSTLCPEDKGEAKQKLEKKAGSQFGLLTLSVALGVARSYSFLLKDVHSILFKRLESTYFSAHAYRVDLMIGTVLGPFMVW